MTTPDDPRDQGTPPLISGILIHEGRHPLGLTYYNWWRCTTCGTTYPAESSRPPTCNGRTIGRCPYCEDPA